jgi:hypothetical protein
MKRFSRVGQTMLQFLACIVLLLICNFASAAICFDYGTRDVVCGPGCDIIQTTTCGFGCISGECYSQGGSGQCCGKMYYSAVIYPDGGKCSECIGVRSHKSGLSAENEIQVGEFPAIWWDSSRGLVKLSKNISYHPPRQTFVLNKCLHIYGVLIERDYPIVVGAL